MFAIYSQNNTICVFLLLSGRSLGNQVLDLDILL